MKENGLIYYFQKADDAYKLYLYDTVTKYGELDWTTWSYKESETSAKYFREQLDDIPDGSTIELHINSAGGEVGEGVTIYNLLKQKAQQGAKIVGYIDGYAYSVAMDIAMACDEIHMGLGTSMLLHYPWAYASGNAKQLRNIADQLDALGTASVGLYMDRAKDLTERELRKMMDAETTLDPETCLKYGFCDVIDTYSKKPDEPQQKFEEIFKQMQQELAETREQLRVQQEINLALKPISRQEPEPASPDPMETVKKAMNIFRGGK